MSKTDTYTKIEPFLRKNQSKTEMSEPLYNTRTIKKLVWNWDFSIEIGVKSRSFELNQLKSDITNVKLVQNWYYKC
jgi:hypothetical protein